MAYAKAHVVAGVLRVDARGRVWRQRIWAGGRWKDVTPRRVENVGGKGYLRVSLAKSTGGLAIVMAHNLVYEVLVGSIPEGLELNHDDLDKTNNRPKNLIPVTGAQNVQHSYDHGRTLPWSHAEEWRPGRPRLTKKQIDKIRRMRTNGRRLRDIAAEFGISISHTSRVAKHARR